MASCAKHSASPAPTSAGSTRSASAYEVSVEAKPLPAQEELRARGGETGEPDEQAPEMAKKKAASKESFRREAAAAPASNVAQRYPRAAGPGVQKALSGKLFAEEADDADEPAKRSDNLRAPAAPPALAESKPGKPVVADTQGLVLDLAKDEKADKSLEAKAPRTAPAVAQGHPAVAGAADAKEGAGAGEDQDACGPQPQFLQPLPRRCHLASNYRSGQGIWQRRLEALTELPQSLRDQAEQPAPAAELLPPETKALAVAARLDREHVEGPGQVWMRVSLRSTDRWGMRRPPFDLAVVLGPAAAAAPDRLACRTLEALVQRIEPQDRLTLIRGSQESENLDGLAGAEALTRVRAACAAGASWATATLADQHRRARQVLAQHAQAQHRVAGSRLVVAIATGADLQDARLQESASQGVLEPTLSSALVLDAAGLYAGWQLADAGHGLLETVGTDPNAAAQRLWHGWGRVVARLVRVDLRLAPGVVALRVVGSRVLDQQETQQVRRQETAVDQNLARVAGVKRDRQQDGEGMTMLIASFLGSDEHVIDVLLEVPGPGPVADVVVDYKDLVRMANEKAMARASLARVSMRGRGELPAIARPDLDRLDWPQLAAVRRAVADRNEPALAELVAALQQRADQRPLAEFALALQAALQQAAAVEPLLAALDVFVARGQRCHVAAHGS